MNQSHLSSLSVFMPAYNEEANIGATLADALAVIPKITPDYEIIVIDDGSQDRTAAIVQEWSRRYPQIRLVSHRHNRGYGAAVKTGLAHSRKDWIFFTDSDGQFKFDELPKFVQAKDKADLIIGYRRRRRDPFHRIFIAQVFLKLWVWFLFGLKVKDVDCAYKLFPKTVATSIKLQTESAITVTEFLVKAKRKGYSFLELPVTHYPRRYGQQTGGHLRVILKALYESFVLFIQLNFNRQS